MYTYHGLAAVVLATCVALLTCDDSLVIGDLNAHDELWQSSMSDERGELLADEISKSSHGVLNEESPTRLPRSGNPSTPDVSLGSMSILLSTSWYTETKIGSDHQPIILRLQLTE